MIKYAKYAVPYLLKAPRRNPVKHLAGFALAYFLLGLSALFIFIASFLWLSKAFGAEVAFAALGSGLLLIALTLILVLKRPLDNNAPMPHSIFFRGGYAVHGTNHVRRLGRPASHGCVRLHPRNAAKLFNLVRRNGQRNARIVIKH